MGFGMVEFEKCLKIIFWCLKNCFFFVVIVLVVVMEERVLVVIVVYYLIVKCKCVLIIVI